MKKILVIIISIACSWGQIGLSEVTYNKENNCLIVIDFPEESPANMQTLFTADKKNNWGKILYDRETNTYTVKAAIWIGDGSGYITYFQIGDKNEKSITLQLKGSLWVRPAANGVRRSDGSLSIVNTLTIGKFGDNSITPKILFDCSRPGEHGIFIGKRDKSGIKKNCSLKMFNTTITSLKPGSKMHRWGGSKYGKITHGCYASSFQLRNCCFTDFKGPLFYGVLTAEWDHRKRQMVPQRNFVIEGCIFENGQNALAANQILRNCQFKNLICPLQDTGSLYFTALNCSFSNNKFDWAMQGYNCRGLNFINCDFNSEPPPFVMKKNAKERRKFGIPEYPGVRLMKTIRIKVVDGNGAPVPYAYVEICGVAEIYRADSITDKNGITGLDTEKDAIVATYREYLATDNQEKPKESKSFKYQVTVTSEGKTPFSSTIQVDGTKDLFTVKLK